MAPRFKEDQVDGQAFLLLNLPTVLDYWNLRMREAILICQLIESVKLAFYKDYAFSGLNRRDRVEWG